MSILGSEDVFDIKTWEDIQMAIAQLLGINIRITDDSGRVRAEYESFNDICAILKKGKKFSDECRKFHGDLSPGKEEPVVCPGKICHYTVSSEFFYRTYNVTVSAMCGETDDEFFEAAGTDSGIHPSDLAFNYAFQPNYTPDKIMSWAKLIANMFTKVMEPAVQTNIMYMAKKEKEDEVNKLKLLMQSNIAINSVKTLYQLLKTVCDSAEKIIEARACLIYFVDYEKNDVYYEPTYSGRDVLAKEERVVLGEGLTGVVAKTGIPMLINDISKEPRFAASDELKNFTTGSYLCVPLTSGGRIIGVIKAVNPPGEKPFTSPDQTFLEAFAAQSAIAIENAIIYEDMEGASFKLNHQLKKTNLNLAIEKKRVESIIKSMEDSVIATDRNNRIVLINKGAEKLFNIRANKVLGSGIEHFVKNREMLDCHMEAVNSLSTVKKEFVLPVFDEDHIFAAVFAPIIDEELTCAGGIWVFRDVAETKKLENLKTEFLNMVAHELRTPLTPIIAYIQLILLKDPPKEKLKKYATLIFRETQRLSTLINDLLDISRIESGKGLTLNIEAANLKELVTNVYDTFRDASPKHNMILDAPVEITAQADRDKITQVIINLFSNATKYSPDGGEIKISLYEDGQKAYISVKDSGIGISKDELPHVFEKFYRVADKKVDKIQGTGIGLTIVKKIMEYHKGGITVESEPGAGSLFTLWLPK